VIQRNVVLASVVVWLGLGCGVDRGEPATQKQQQPITGGKDDPGHPEVGRILIDAQGGTAKDTCSAVLVGTKTVLTAAHCCKPTVNNLFQLEKKIYQIDKVIPHPSWNPSNSKYKNDIGLVLLKDPVTSVTAFPAYGTVAPAQGKAVKLVGFGRTSETASDSGTRRVAENTVESVGTGYFTVTGLGNICFGDSGGPVYTSSGGKEVVVGIMSADQSPYCAGTKSYHVSVKSFVAWVSSQLSPGDKTPPQVAITAPKDGATVATSALLTIAATDNVGVVSVTAEVDGTSAGTPTGTGPYQLALTLTPGSHTIKATARDAAGNTGSDQVTVTAVSGPVPDLGVVDGTGGSGDAQVAVGDGGATLRGEDGCSVGGGGPTLWHSLVLLLAAILLLVRRQLFAPAPAARRRARPAGHRW
jgi:secreted trypsin-like serine protease